MMRAIAIKNDNNIKNKTVMLIVSILGMMVMKINGIHCNFMDHPNTHHRGNSPTEPPSPAITTTLIPTTTPPPSIHLLPLG